MSTPSPRTRLLVVGADLTNIHQLQDMIEEHQAVEIIGHASGAIEAIRLAGGTRPDVICVDLSALGSEGIAIAEAVAARLPQARVVMILPSGQTDTTLLQRAMRAGAGEFLVRPFTPVEFVNAVQNARRLEKPVIELDAPRPPAVEPAPEPPALLAPRLAPEMPPNGARPGTQGQIITVFSANGGVGRSTIAVNLAIALKDAAKARVVLLDADLRFGDVGILLNLRSNRSIVDVCTAQGIADLELLPSVLLTHYSGVRVLLGPLGPEFGEMVTPAALSAVVRALREQFDYVVVDTHAFLEESLLMLLETSDKVVLLATSELPSMKNTKQFLHIADLLDFDPNKLLLVLNRHNPKDRIAPADIEASIKHKIFAVVERDDKVATAAMQTGQPFVLHQKSTVISRNVQQLAQLLVAQPEREDVPPKRRRGLFGR